MSDPVTSDATVSVQPVTPALATQLCALRVEAGQYGYVGDTQAALVEAAGNPHCKAMAVLLGDEVIGFYCLDFDPPGSRPAIPTARIRGLRIDRRVQRRGLGRRALAACIDDVRRRHPQVRRLTACVDSVNRHAIDLYQRAGFAEAGIWNFGGIVPQQMLQLQLDPAGQDGVGQSRP